jgi:formylglycine-generating enzyme required for sulfatase activity
MVSIPRTRATIGLTQSEADRLANELAKMEGDLDEPGLGGFRVFDLAAAAAKRRAWLAASIPAYEVEVGPFEIDVYPVTNAQWSLYCAETGAAPPAVHGPEQCFVSGISWEECAAYAKHYKLDLPMEAEWEVAARFDRRFFTWGDSYFPQGNVAFAPPVDMPYAVGTRAATESPQGVHDLLGQFGEYTRDPFRPYPGADAAVFAKLFPGTAGQRTVHGGYDVYQDATCVSRRPVPAGERRKHLKFRCVRR